jgi:hypothetical protein
MKKYPQVESWGKSWEKRIDELFHANRLRLNQVAGSDVFERENAHVQGLLREMEKRFEEELGQAELHHAQRSVLKSLKVHWAGLCVFVDSPQIPMDNNGSERVLRNAAVGRKNYYGSGAIWSGRLTAVMLSVFETCKLWGINPRQWLMEYFDECAKSGGKPPPEISAHLPWNMKERKQVVKRYGGRDFSQAEIDLIKEITDGDCTRHRTAMARTACEQLDWRAPNGSYKIQSMLIVLKRMERDGLIDLPESQIKQKPVLQPIRHTEKTDPKADLIAAAGQLRPLSFTVPACADEHALWNEYIDRYHYLGHKTLAGTNIKYFVHAGDDLVALLGFSSAAWRVAPRDWFIEWSDEARKKNLHLIVNNARFLILPWVISKNLASRILSLASRQIVADWEARYAYRPVLLETFVEKDRFAGTCYKAANWKYVGVTQGRGKKDRFNRLALPKKDIFLYPLVKNFRPLLC